MLRRWIVAALFGAYLLALLDLTLVRFPQPGALPNWVPFKTIAYYAHLGGLPMWRNVAGNLIAFVPLGFLVPALRRDWRSLILVAALSFAASVLIELIQYLSAQRVADVDDVFLNTLGGILGYVAFLIAARVWPVDASVEPAT